MKLALIGGKLTHSYSAIIHDLFFKYTGLKGTYELIEINDALKIGMAMNNFESEGYTGINVTIPHKQKILEYVTDLSEEVSKLEAANTILFKDGKRFAYNTDYFGFKKTLEMNNVEPLGEKWLVLGDGGGSKSVIAVLGDMGAAEIKIASRKQHGGHFLNYEDISGLQGFAGVVNTTPLGMYPNIDSSRLNREELANFRTAVDIVYNPLETKFLKYADEEGLKTVKGLYMLVAQAVKAQEIWNSRLFGDDLIDRIYKEVGAGL